jgi:hypothetical protein
MRNGSFWLGFLAYLVPTFPLGYFWHLAWFHDRYDALAIYRPDVVIPMGLASMVIQAAIFSWSYPKLFSTERAAWMRSALKIVVVFGLFAWSYSVLPVAAKYQMTSVKDFVLLETGFTFLQFAIVAPLLSLAFRGKQS